jgi:4-hydroxy-4-methyl-2-oxoglutarate aldolase
MRATDQGKQAMHQDDAQTTGLSDQVREELKALGAATLHEAQGQTGAMDHGIRPIDPAMRLVGTALTVDAKPGDNLIVHLAVQRARSGDVLVIDAKGFLEGGLWGDVLAVAALQKGVAGLVVDGAVRDSQTMAELGFAVFARGLSIKGTQKNQPGRVGVAITCGGITVRQGDIVVGDRDGVVVIPAPDLEEVLARARERAAKEDLMRKELAAGRSTVELLDLGPRLRQLGLA